MENGWKRVVARLFSICHFPFRISHPPTMSGCAAAGVLAYKIHGPPKVPAKYVPAQTPMLCWSRITAPDVGQRARGFLAQEVGTSFDLHNVAPIIPLEKLQSLA